MTKSRNGRGLMLVALAMLGLGGCDYMPGPRKDAIDAVKKELADPYSAKFEDVGPCPKNPEMYQGKVNAKNRLGAYTGLTSFYTIHGVAFTEASDLERLLNDRGYSYVLQLNEACLFGSDPDLGQFMKAVDAGTAPTLTEIARETDEEKHARLGLPPFGGNAESK